MARGRLPLWVSLYLDALAGFATDNGRSGLAHLYMSFEMLVYLACERLGTAVVGAPAARSFLYPVGAEPPGVHVVLKRARDWAVAGPSKTQLQRQFSPLWKHRNDILHGRNVQITETAVSEAIAAFETVAAWLESATPAASLRT